MHEIADNYWIVGGDAVRFWSSRRTAYVPADDLALRCWRSVGGVPSAVATEADLTAILKGYGLRGPLLTEADYQAAIVAMLDTKARERRYDSAGSIATYVASTNPAWAAEAQAFVAWRDAVWAYAYAQLDLVKDGERPQPSVEGFLKDLPVLTWPA